MTKHKTDVCLSKLQAADKLDAIAAELRSGTLKTENSGPVPVADDVEMKTKIEDDELEIKIEWEKA